MKRFLYTLIQWTWGFPQNFIGLLMFIGCKIAKCKSNKYKNAVETKHYDKCCICEKNGWTVDGKRPECYYNDGSFKSDDSCWEQEIFDDDSYFYITEEEFYD